MDLILDVNIQIYPVDLGKEELYSPCISFLFFGCHVKIA